MTTNVTRINPSNIKECTVPAAMQKIESSESAFVITIGVDGKWHFQSIKNKKSNLELIGLLQCISRKLEQVSYG